MTFTNTTNGAGNTTRPVSLTVNDPASLVITPGTGLTSTGLVGGPFTPTNVVYTLENTGDVPLDWTAAKVATWLDLSDTSGTIAAGLTATVTTLNTGADSLAAGVYTDTVTFTNTTNGAGNTTRPVSLTVNDPASLVITPGTGLKLTDLWVVRLLRQMCSIP